MAVVEFRAGGGGKGLVGGILMLNCRVACHFIGLF